MPAQLGIAGQEIVDDRPGASALVNHRVGEHHLVVIGVQRAARAAVIGFDSLRRHGRAFDALELPGIGGKDQRCRVAELSPDFSGVVRVHVRSSVVARVGPLAGNRQGVREHRVQPARWSDFDRVGQPAVFPDGRPDQQTRAGPGALPRAAAVDQVCVTAVGFAPIHQVQHAPAVAHQAGISARLADRATVVHGLPVISVRRPAVMDKAAVMRADQRVQRAVGIGRQRHAAMVVLLTLAHGARAHDFAVGQVHERPPVLPLDIEPRTHQMPVPASDLVAHHIAGGSVSARSGQP